MVARGLSTAASMVVSRAEVSTILCTGTLVGLCFLFNGTILKKHVVHAILGGRSYEGYMVLNSCSLFFKIQNRYLKGFSSHQIFWRCFDPELKQDYKFVSSLSLQRIKIL
jgi:hypothetical protein